VSNRDPPQAKHQRPTLHYAPVGQPH